MPNILFITADQWRGDCLGYAGHPVVKTPNLDRLAAEGVAFLNHFAQAAPCSPARACLYTGLYQMNNRVVRNGTPLDARFDNLALAARRAGYDPTLFGYTDQSPDPRDLPPGDPMLTTYEGVLPGFSARVKLPEHEKAWLSWLRTQGLELVDHAHAHLPVGVAPGTISNAPPAYSKDQTQTAFLTDEFIRWLGEQDAGRPWFAHLSFLRPHPPFIVPAPYNTMFSPDEVEGFARAADAEAEMALHPLSRFGLSFTGKDSFVPAAEGRVKDLSDAEFRQIKATYYGMIAEVDAQLGRVFDAVRAANGRPQQTLSESWRSRAAIVRFANAIFLLPSRPCLAAMVRRKLIHPSISNQHAWFRTDRDDSEISHHRGPHRRHAWRARRSVGRGRRPHPGGIGGFDPADDAA